VISCQADRIQRRVIARRATGLTRTEPHAYSGGSSVRRGGVFLFDFARERMHERGFLGLATAFTARRSSTSGGERWGSQ